MAWTNPKTWARLDSLDAATLNEQVRDNLLYLKARPVAHRTRTVSGSNAALATNDDVFGAPTLDLTLASAGHVMAGCQMTFFQPVNDLATDDFSAFEIRMRCYQQTPLKTVDVPMDFYVSYGSIVSLAPSSLFIGFAAGVVSFSVTLTAGAPIQLLTGDHLIWAMEV